MKLVMSTSALIGRRPIAMSRRCSQSGEGPFFTPRTIRRAKAGQREGGAPKSSVTATGQGKRPSTDLIGASLSLPMPAAARSRAMPLTPVQSAASGGGLISVTRCGGEVDLDHGIIEAGPGRIARADRRIRGKLDDALVVVGQLQLERGHQHAAAFDATDRADTERHVLARNEHARRPESAPHAGA